MLKEEKVAIDLVELTENKWFNPAVFGRMLSQQPHYTVNKVMEMVAQVISHAAIRHEQEAKGGYSSEGLILAHKLMHSLQEAKKEYNYKHVRIPKI